MTTRTLVNLFFDPEVLYTEAPTRSVKTTVTSSRMRAPATAVGRGESGIAERQVIEQ